MFYIWGLFQTEETTDDYRAFSVEKKHEANKEHGRGRNVLAPRILAHFSLVIQKEKFDVLAQKLRNKDEEGIEVNKGGSAAG